MSARLRALLIVLGTLAATALPTVAAFAAQPHVPPTVPHSTPREEIQPATNIVGQLARRTAERSTRKPLGLVPEQAVHPIALTGVR
ncbi:hypothetical protein AB0N81_31150 [Streptomyces sp. NPDC093510]|uniref:hypothetical protein n=1 Tax=Streptomyces sp. NPDC093510 TaxID=3155199 RepID=UPI0034147A87